QMVTKMSGVSNWQLRGFRAAYSGLDKTLRLTGVQYNGYGVTGTKDVPKASNTQLLDYPMMAKEVSSVYSTDVTAVVDKYANVGLSYYKYTWNEATGKYDVVSVATSAEGNSGGISFFGRLDLDIYANGTRVFGVTNMPYNAGAPDSVGNGGANTYYAIRVYSTTLTPEEIAQNHFADLAGYYGYDLSLYYRLSEEDRAALHNQLKTLELGSPAADAVEKYESVFAGLYYRFATDSEESDTFREFAAKYKLAIENLAPLSPLAQDRIFKQFTTPEMLASEYVYPVLQDALENAIKTVRKNYYAESYVHTVTQFEGYQLRKTGEYGFRALFTLDADALGNIHAMYPTANVTIGTLLLPSTLAGETVVTVNPQGGVEYHSEIIDKTVAYDADGYTNDVFEYQGNLSYACEYILPEDGDVNTKFAFVNYVVIELEGEAPVVYTVNANTISGEGISLFELTQYAKENEGMAYENIQSLINDEVGTTDAVLTVGNGNISDYVIVEDGWNTPGVEQVVALVKQYIGVDMRVVTAAEAAAYERRLYIGRECDVKYEDADLYGLNASPYTLSLWYFDEDNCDAAIALFEEILMLAEGDSYTIETGTDYVRRAR
ncbi:MAG: hypothetical protein J6V07_02940, partial [Clostridia bacterium]|nr:hypothetical protein [Clostridia bacterium]